MRTAIFKTKFVSEEHRNGQEVKIIKKIDSFHYEVEFPDGEVQTVYSSELDFGY